MQHVKVGGLIASLGITQIVGWGSVFYAYGILMQAMQEELQLSRPVVVAAFSIALLISGLLSTLVGSLIDRYGGRLLMSAGSVLCAALLLAMSFISSAMELYLVWAVIGIGMSCTLYHPAFAVVTQHFQSDYRRAIALVTLFGGFASTISWPLTQWLLDHYGWRSAWQVYALAHIVICLPLHAMLPKVRVKAQARHKNKSNHSLSSVLREPTFYPLAIAFTLNALVFSAMSLHLMPILKEGGMPAHFAAATGALLGPMQVLGRVLEPILGRLMNIRQVGLLAISLVPAALLFLFAPGSWLTAYGLFVAMYGLGTGIITIIRGTLPAELYGRESYGAISGAISTPVMIAFAAGPYVASLLYSLGNGYPVAIASLTLTAALAALLFHCAIKNIPEREERDNQFDPKGAANEKN